jgi:hypothetical protein
MKINTKYNIEDSVYLVTDAEQSERIIISITILPNSLIVYSVMCGTESSEHYEFELCETVDVIKKTSN